MKNFFLGCLLTALIYGSIANAVEITIDKFTIRDLFAGCALAGIISNPDIKMTPEAAASQAWNYANALAAKRKDR